MVIKFNIKYVLDNIIKLININIIRYVPVGLMNFVHTYSDGFDHFTK